MEYASDCDTWCRKGRVSETNPESMYINQSTVNHEMRKANRAQCRKDRDEFEELAYSIQDEIISKVATAKED